MWNSLYMYVKRMKEMEAMLLLSKAHMVRHPSGKLNDRRPMHIKIASAVLIALCVSSLVAQASVGDIVDSFISGILNMMSQILISICDMLIGPIFEITTMTIDEVATYIPGFNVNSEMGAFFLKALQALGNCIAACLAIFSVIQLVISLVSNEKVESITSVIWRIFVFVPLTIYGSNLLKIIFNQVISPISTAFAGGVLSISPDNAIFASIAAPIVDETNDLAVLIIGTVLIVMIGFNLIALVLEAAERYIICIVIIFLSPLAFAAGVNQSTTQVAKNWFRMFWSHCVLLILNIWVIGIARTCLETIDGSATPSQFICWAIISYAYLKIAQRLDDILQNSGLLVTRTGGDFMRDAFVAASAMATTVKAMGDTAHLGSDIRQIRKNSPDGMAKPEDIAQPIRNFQNKHPILGAPVSAAAKMQNNAVNYAQTRFAEGQLSHTSDMARAAAMGNANLNKAAYRHAIENTLNQNGRSMGFEKIGGKDGAQVENLTKNADGTVSGTLVQRDANGNIARQVGFTMSNPTGKAEDLSFSHNETMKVAPDGKSAIIEDTNTGAYKLQQTGVDESGRQIWEASRIRDENGNEISAAESGTQSFTIRPNAHSEDGDASQAASQFMNSSVYEDTAKASNAAIEHNAAVARDYEDATKAFNSMTDDDRIASMRQDTSSENEPEHINYSSEGYREAMASYMKSHGLETDIFDRGGQIESQELTADGTVSGVIAVRDSDNNLKEERHFNFSTESPMTRTNEAGEPEEIPAGERKIVGFVENTLECKYNAADEYSGYVETSNLGKTTLSRVSVDEDTGDSKWQLINREPGAQGDSGGVVTFERKGNRGKSETFYDVVKDLKNVNSFDEAALIDFRNKNRPKK